MGSTQFTETGPLAVMQRLQRAQNAHDLDAFVACFAPDYRSEQPAHPVRRFVGSQQVRKNWGSVFQDLPDFRSELLACAVADDEAALAEWRWTGTNPDGSHFQWQGVTVLGVRDGQIAWGRLYMEPVEQGGDDIEETVRHMTRDADPVSRSGAIEGYA